MNGFIRVDIASQKLSFIENGQVVRDYPVSTGAQGYGCESGSYKTPTGLHRIRLKIGEGQPLIYIHGTPDDGMQNPPSSHGCIRMYNADVVELFLRVSTGTRVLIETGT
ncbi:L,D-transpeptidase [Castellaniella sp.]|uniref:L,D-transpeptidase n=1 Tax=Castellaniella sp. TaxID=1955812 RepID=UPI002AFF9E88|nr:L,D-transpeptidase [Castellaniella sp.]